MRHVCFIVVVASLVAAVRADGPPRAPAKTLPSHPFVFVFIDDQTEKELGPFPYDRAVYARAVDRAAALGAKGVLIKFFLDRRGSPEGDRALTEAMKKTKVILQARLDDSEPRPNELPARFHLDVKPAGDEPLAGSSGWLPLPEFAAQACDIGFIDDTSLDRMPIVERYRGHYVKSLFTCAIELATGHPPSITPAKGAAVGGAAIPLDHHDQAAIRLPARDDLEFIPLTRFLDTAQRVEARDRVVVLAWDASRFPALDTPIGKVRPHRVFGYALLSLYNDLRVKERQVSGK